MGSSEFLNGIEEARRRVEQLRQRSSGSVPQNENVIAAALEELQVALEELQVADEEMRQQNEELLETRNALEQERRRYIDLFEAAPDAYVVTNPAGVIAEANVAAGGLCGVAPRFLAGKPLSVFVTAEKLEAFLTEIHQLAKGGAGREFELRMQQRQGKAYDASIRVAAVRDLTGKPTALRWLIRDISARKRNEEEILKTNAELERRVSERTGELKAANRLKDDLLVREQQARADAEAANKSKDEFLATLGHELRTPLNAIVGWTHILNTKPRDEKLVDRAIEVIKRNAVSQSQIVNDLLDVSRIIAGNLQLEFRDVSLSHIIEVVMEAMQPIADAKSIQIESTLDTSGRMVSGDPVRLQQIVWNLVANAIHFTPAGGRVAIKLEHLDEVRLTVTDTGDGISPEFLPYVFDRFRQADGSSTRRHGGLGLGLSIVRRLIELHGGNVIARSQGTGQGATFVVSLPFAEQAQGQAGEPGEPTSQMRTRGKGGEQGD